MIIPVFSRTYRVKLSDSATRQVVCEQCRTVYQYEVKQVVVGTGQSVYMLDNEGAQARAAADAVRLLERRMQLAVKPVPCPTCGWLQHDMVDEIKRTSRGFLFWTFAVTLPALMTVVAWMTLILGTKIFARPLEADLWPWMIGLVSGIVVSLMLGITLRRRQLKRIEPNRDWQGLPAGYTLPNVPFAEKTIGYAAGGDFPRERRFGRWTFTVYCAAAGVVGLVIAAISSQFTGPSPAAGIIKNIGGIGYVGGLILLLIALIKGARAAR